MTTGKSSAPSKQPASLVTGSSGFQGSHLSDTLLAEGHDVTFMDTTRLGAAGQPRRASRRTIRHFKQVLNK